MDSFTDEDLRVIGLALERYVIFCDTHKTNNLAKDADALADRVAGELRRRRRSRRRKLSYQQNQ